MKTGRARVPGGHLDEPPKREERHGPESDTECAKSWRRIGSDDAPGGRGLSALPLLHRPQACPALGHAELPAGRQLAGSEVRNRQVDRVRRWEAIWKRA